MVHELDRHSLRLLTAPAAQQFQHDVLAADPRLKPAAHDDSPRLGEREVDVTGRPPEAERRRAHTHANCAVRAVGPAVRIGAGNELTRQHEALFRKVEVKDPIARRRVVRRRQALLSRECATDARLLLIVITPGEDEMIVGNGRLSRTDHVAASDLVEGVDRKRRRSVGGRKQVGVHAQRVARLESSVDPCRRGAPR